MDFQSSPLVPKGGSALRVLIMHRSHRVVGRFEALEAAEDFDFSATLRDLALVHSGKPEIVLVCDTSPQAAAHRTLAAAWARVEAGGVDLVAMRDLMQISRYEIEVLEFLNFSVRHGTRVIAFDTQFDTADINWEETLLTHGVVDPAVEEMWEREEAARSSDSRWASPRAWR